MPQHNADLEPGFYWVRTDGEMVVGHYTGPDRGWELPGMIGDQWDDSVELIDPTPIPKPNDPIEPDSILADNWGGEPPA